MDFNKISEAVKFLIATAWGFTLLAPGSTFENGKGYLIMAKLASEEIWGLIPLFISILYFLTFKWKPARKISLFVLMTFWIVVAASIFFANNLSTATAAYIGYAILSVISFLRVGRH